MALYWFSQGVGSLLGVITIQLFEGIWFTSFDHGNINCQTFYEAGQHCHLDYYFYLVAGLQVLGLIAFVAVTWGANIGRSVAIRVHRDGHTLVRASDHTAERRRTATNGPTRSINRDYRSGDPNDLFSTATDLIHD